MLIYTLKPNPQKAFTLLELIIVIAIVSILVGVAYPSYQQSVMKSRRADAIVALYGLSLAMERHFTKNDTYCDAGTSGSCTGNGPSYYGYYETAPINGGTATYTLEIVTANLTSYTLQATPTGTQSGDACGTFELDNTGDRSISGNTDIEKNECWGN